MKTVCIVGLGIGSLYKSVATSLGWQYVTVDSNPQMGADFLSVSLIPTYMRFDMAIICTPNHTHEVIARLLVKHTHRIVVEKPGFETYQAWVNFQNEYPTVKLFMVKNNMYRTKEIDYLREQMAEHGVSSIRIFWVNKNRIPGAGSWFTTKSLAYGGVSRDLMPHALSVVQALLKEPAIGSKNFVARRRQMYTLEDDVYNSNYGNTNPDGVYDVDDQAYFHTYVNDVFVECCTTWKMDNIARDYVEWRIKLKNGIDLTYHAGLCPESAYAEMLDAYMLMTDRKYQEYMQYDRHIHHILENFLNLNTVGLIQSAINEN